MFLWSIVTSIGNQISSGLDSSPSIGCLSSKIYQVLALQYQPYRQMGAIKYGSFLNPNILVHPTFLIHIDPIIFINVSMTSATEPWLLCE